MTFTNLVRITLALLVAGTFSARSFAQAALPTKKIVRSVQVVSAGGAQIDENRIKANMGTRAGQPFEEEVVERDIKNLYATGLVEMVDITTQDVAGGVNVLVKVTGRGAIGEVAFTGNTVFDADRLRKEVEVKINEPVEESKLFTGANKIRELYNKKGFADVSVEYKLESLPTAGFVRVVYHINEGARGVIHDIRFEGLTAVKEKALRSKLKLKESAPGTSGVSRASLIMTSCRKTSVPSSAPFRTVAMCTRRWCRCAANLWVTTRSTSCS